MSDGTVSDAERLLAVEAVRTLAAEARISMEDLRARLQPEDLTVLARKPGPDLDCSLETYQRLLDLIDWAGTRPDSAPDHSIVFGPHGTVAHEVVEIDLLLIEFDAGDTLMVRELLERAVDTRVRITHANLPQVAGLLGTGKFQVALLNLTRASGCGPEMQARSELITSPVPVISLIDPEDEPQAIHLGDRDYLVRSQLDARLLVRTLRSAVEHHRLARELELSKQREHWHATRDAMTGLPNRTHFREQLGRALAFADRHDKHVSVLFLDLDRFKSINDTLGHAAGDELLLTAARRLSGALRQTDMVARVGGDEFLLMLQGSNLDYAPANIAGKILDALAKPIQVAGEQVSTTASIGIATFPRDGTDPDSLIRNADAALYEAKARGRDGYQFYSQSVDAAAMRRMIVENKLRVAVERRAFEVYYQPRVNVATGRIVGSEALLRWHDDELGDVSPTEFIPVAEDAGLIPQIGQWVIRKALAQHRVWQDSGFPSLRISVNISTHQIREGTLRESILRPLWDTGIDPSRVEVEITESALIQNSEVAAEVLGQLTEIGIGVSLDDFGTGFSSLSYLKRFPVDTIKIDQSFVRDILFDPEDASITDAILSIAEKLRLNVVAEGVATRGQRDFLSARGCREMQGYLFSPPVPADEFFALLRSGPIRG